MPRAEFMGLLKWPTNGASMRESVGSFYEVTKSGCLAVELVVAGSRFRTFLVILLRRYAFQTSMTAPRKYGESFRFAAQRTHSEHVQGFCNNVITAH